MNDSTLRQQILDELRYEPSIDENDIGVAVEDGIVTLTGHVPNYSQKAAVTRAVGRLKGVRGIADEIQVRYPGTSGTSDDEIAKRVLDTLRWNVVVPEDKVQVKVQKGLVTLSGKVAWHYQKTAAADAVRDLHGVTAITNLIEVHSPPSSIDVKKHIEDALRRNAELEAKAIRVDVLGDKVVLKGSVRAWNDRTVAERAAWGTPGVRAVEDQLTIG